MLHVLKICFGITYALIVWNQESYAKSVGYKSATRDFSSRKFQDVKRYNKRFDNNIVACTQDEFEEERVNTEDPCEHCYCRGGKLKCIMTPCMAEIIDCVDFVEVTDMCCVTKICPNGANCWHRGQLMSGEIEEYHGICKSVYQCPFTWQVGEYTQHTQAVEIARYCQ